MRVSAESPRRAALPEAVAQQVLSAPRDYPMHLWELAEAGAATKARKAVRAVGQLQKRSSGSPPEWLVAAQASL